MPWWGFAYAAVFAIISIGSAIANVRGRQRPAWHVILDLTTGGLLILLVVARWHSHLVAGMGRSLAAVFLGMLLWDIYSTSRDLDDIAPDPELTHRANLWIERASIGFGAILMAPGYALALMSVVNAWQAG